ncbi:FMN-binding negative transcriptional regulator [Actinoplanes sp. NPDC049599]|uniref:FMN-binding negative transcriptional regulator n=1 Tax=Actinoplanes sp. NPDC049599 TaxID=3363903 RepID=UPI0037B4D11F
MLVPTMYQAASPGQITAVVTGHPMAVLVTNGSPVPHATHLPVIPVADGNIRSGSTLWGHMNRANPHWRSLDAGTAGKLVFSGPGTYVCPVLYETEPAAPTWDFAVVHLSGRIIPIAPGEPTLAVVRRTAATLEHAFGAGWDQNSSVDYFRALEPGVGAFEFVVGDVEAMFKLSQEKEPAVRQRIMDDFAGTPRNGSVQVSRLMSELGLGIDS